MLISSDWDHLRQIYYAGITIVCLILFPCLTGAAFGSDRCGSLDRAANAIRLAEIIYPELEGREFSLQFSEGSGPPSGPADVGSFLIAVDKPQWHPPGETEEELKGAPQPRQSGSADIELPLYLDFSFVKEPVVGKTGTVVGRELSCQPVKFMNRVGSKEIHQAAELINAHPQWTDAQDWEAARKLGMRYGPDKKSDLLRTLPLKELSSVYGPLQVTETEFITAAGSKEPESNFAVLNWLIIAKHLGTPNRLQIMVEPFHGKIIAISD